MATWRELVACFSAVDEDTEVTFDGAGVPVAFSDPAFALWCEEAGSKLDGTIGDPTTRWLAYLWDRIYPGDDRSHVLWQSAAAAAKSACLELAKSENGPDTKPDIPSWSKDTGKLSFRGKVVREIRCPRQAKNVVRILDAFEEENWPTRIDDPIPGSTSTTFHDTLSSLRQGLSLIHFRADGTGEGIVWEIQPPG